MAPGRKSIISITAAIPVLVMFCVFVWPTRFRYGHMKLGDSVLPVRTDRLSGKTEVLFPDGWRDLSDEKVNANQRPTNAERPLPPDAIGKLSTQGTITSYGWIEVSLYDGSNWNTSELTVNVEVSDPSGKEVMSRPYRLIPEDGERATPQTSTNFHAPLGFALSQGQTWSFGIA